MRDGDDWRTEKHGGKKPRKTWRKLHIALDPDTGEIVAAEITTEHLGDETALPDLLASINADVTQFLADGAYDGQGLADYLIDKFGPEIDIIIPPPKNAIHRANVQRNRHIDAIAEYGKPSPDTIRGHRLRLRSAGGNKSSAIACKRAISTIKPWKHK